MNYRYTPEPQVKTSTAIALFVAFAAACVGFGWVIVEGLAK